jgi:hypothetical protein
MLSLKRHWEAWLFSSGLPGMAQDVGRVWAHHTVYYFFYGVKKEIDSVKKISLERLVLLKRNASTHTASSPMNPRASSAARAAWSQ